MRGDHMYTKQSKKMLPFDVLDILKKYTDMNHRLTQRDIERILRDKYDMVVDRRSIKRGIVDLIEMGFEIQYNEITRNRKDQNTGEEEEQAILTNFYLERDFSDCEIRLLIDELLDSKYVPNIHRKQLISKLEGLSSVYFRKSKNMIENTDSLDENQQLFFTIDIIDEAISAYNKVSFRYKIFLAGKNGRVEVDYDSYVVTPKEMKIVDGEYLLLCNDEVNKEMTLRIDYITDISILSEKGHRGSYSTKNVFNNERNVRFLASEGDLPIFVEKFGRQSIIIEDDKDEMVLKIRTSADKAVQFGIDHSDTVTVISPETVRYAVIDKLRSGINRYKAV